MMTKEPDFDLHRLKSWSADTIDLILITSQSILNQMSC